jgi:hypothetical protein
MIGSLPCLGCRAERLQVEAGLTRRVAIYRTRRKADMDLRRRSFMRGDDVLMCG